MTTDRLIRLAWAFAANSGLALALHMWSPSDFKFLFMLATLALATVCWLAAVIRYRGGQAAERRLLALWESYQQTLNPQPSPWAFVNVSYRQLAAECGERKIQRRVKETL